MKKEMIRIYRKSSPRTGREYDVRSILAKNLKKHLAAGWSIDPPEDDADADLIPPSMLNQNQIEEIRNAPGTQRSIAAKYCVSSFTVHKIKAGKL
jgi:hypothetical protein